MKDIEIQPEQQNYWERLYLSLTGNYDISTWNSWGEYKSKYCDIDYLNNRVIFDVVKMKKYWNIPDDITELSCSLKTADNMAHICGKFGICAFSFIVNRLIE